MWLYLVTNFEALSCVDSITFNSAGTIGTDVGTYNSWNKVVRNTNIVVTYRRKKIRSLLNSTLDLTQLHPAIFLRYIVF